MVTQLHFSYISVINHPEKKEVYLFSLLYLMNIKLFGIAKEIIGNNYLLVEVENMATVGALKQWLLQQYPALQDLKSVAVAVNSEYANDATYIDNKSEIALLPPVSGG